MLNGSADVELTVSGARARATAGSGRRDRLALFFALARQGGWEMANNWWFSTEGPHYKLIMINTELLTDGTYILSCGQIPLAQLVRHLGQGTAVAISALEVHRPFTEATANVRLLKPVPDRSTPHRRQLGWIPHQQQPATAGQRL